MKTDITFTLPDPPSAMRTENMETETFIHRETIALSCSCGEEHADHMAATTTSIKMLTESWKLSG